MIRIAFLEILLFATPFMLFALWRLAMTASAEVAEHRPAPTMILSGIGGFLAAGGLILFVFFAQSGDSEHSNYQPPRLENGGVRNAEFNDTPGERPNSDTRNFGTAAQDEDGEDDDEDPPRPR